MRLAPQACPCRPRQGQARPEEGEPSGRRSEKREAGESAGCWKLTLQTIRKIWIFIILKEFTFLEPLLALSARRLLKYELHSELVHIRAVGESIFTRCL